MNKNKNLIKNIAKLFIIMYIFFNSYLFQCIPIYLFNIDINNISGSMQVILNSFSNIVLVLILFIIYRKDLKKDWLTFKSKLVDNLNTGFTYWFCGLFIMLISNLIINFVFKAGAAGNEETVQSMIKYLPWLMFINTGFIAPFNEEIIFRKTFKDIFKNKWAFVFISSLIFGGAHVIGNVSNFLDILYIIPYGALGGAFALAYYKSDSIFTSMTVHMFHNSVLVLLSIL